MATEAQVRLPQLANHKLKLKTKPGQRSCNEKNDKGKNCGGHLKRWYYVDDIREQACGDVKAAFGDAAEIYRCEHCRTLYLPHPDEPGGRNVAGYGQLSVFGLTVPPKPTKEKYEQQTAADKDKQVKDALPG